MFKKLLNTLKKNEQNEIKIDEKTIRLIECSDCGRIYWSAKDACEMLDIDDPEQALNALDPDMRIEMISEYTKVDALTASGLFALVFHSKTQFAKDTQRWIIDEFVRNNYLSEGETKELGLLPAEAVC